MQSYEEFCGNVPGISSILGISEFQLNIVKYFSLIATKQTDTVISK